MPAMHCFAYVKLGGTLYRTPQHETRIIERAYTGMVSERRSRVPRVQHTDTGFAHVPQSDGT